MQHNIAVKGNHAAYKTVEDKYALRLYTCRMLIQKVLYKVIYKTIQCRIIIGKYVRFYVVT
jgi:hypothetical protein